MRMEKIKFLYEDNDLLVCVKPAGIATQSRNIGAADLESILRNRLARQQEEKKQGTHGSAQTKPYLAVIHRLDQPVEGLLVFAKTPAAARGLNKQLTTQGFGKHYRATLEGIPSSPQGTLENYLCRDTRSNLTRICTPGTPGAQFARLSYLVTKTEGERATVEVALDTGRHHQIRAQMAGLGCPIIGDVKYGAAPSETGKIALLAYRLEFRHPTTNKPMRFELP